MRKRKLKEITKESSGRETFDRFLKLREPLITWSTIQAYRSMTNEFFNSEFGRQQVQAITCDDIIEWIGAMRDNGLNPNTIRKKMEILKVFFFWCQSRDLIESDPLEHVPTVRAAIIYKHGFTYEHYQQLLALVRGRIERYTDLPTYWTHAMTVMWHTGLRISDVANLKWEQIDFLSDILIARPQKLAFTRQQLTIPIEAELRDHLLSMPNDGTSPYVEPIFQMQYLSHRTMIAGDFRKFCDKLGLYEYSAHSFRHGFVSRLLNSGCDATIVSSLTGQCLKTIMGYAHISIDAKQNALANARNHKPHVRSYEPPQMSRVRQGNG